MQRSVEKYKIFEMELSGGTEGNPFLDTEVTVEFTNGLKQIVTKGFYKENGIYAIRFMPQKEGEWKYTVHSNDNRLNGETGKFVCTPASETNHGRVCLKKDVFPKKDTDLSNTEDKFQFAYEDGTRYQPFGTTCYAWINQPEKIQKKTLKTLKTAPFNKIRMCIFPKFYTYNTTNPEDYVFQGDADKGFDFTRFNNKFFEKLENRIGQLDDLGIEADIILLHPYDCWGFSKMSREQDIFYLSYVVRRLSHYKNVWWSLANEFDLMRQKTIEDWELYADVIQKNDPYGHLRSIHNCVRLYDHSSSWITHVSVQRLDNYKTAEMVTEWREKYKKPVIVDEVGYEGNIDFGWGCLTAEELIRRYWEGCVRGGYLSHGETYVDRGNQIWWSHGGELYGESTDRIKFLKSVMESAPEDAEPLKLTRENHKENWDSICLHDGEKWFLYYYGFFRPLYRNYTLPEGKKYKIELIDTWNMTIEELPEIYEGKIRIKMGGKQYMAVRMREVQ